MGCRGDESSENKMNLKSINCVGASAGGYNMGARASTTFCWAPVESTVFAFSRSQCMDYNLDKIRLEMMRVRNGYK